MRKTIEIAGQSIELDKRTCDGGCGKEFWVPPTSSQTRAKGNCEWVCKNKAMPQDVRSRQSRCPGVSDQKPIGLGEKMDDDKKVRLFRQGLAKIKEGYSIESTCRKIGVSYPNWYKAIVTFAKSNLPEQYAEYKKATQANRGRRKPSSETKQKPMQIDEPDEQVETEVAEEIQEEEAEEESGQELRLFVLTGSEEMITRIFRELIA